ncbi:MAG: putative conserved rane protein [Fibrobacteres bacterium]|nr:putative conserved rane protein [Fibrobacterota bacterium]
MRLTWAETRRKCAHMAAFWPAFFLPWMTPLQALGVAFLLVLMNVFILPWAAKGLYRAEATGMGALEIVLYPSALMACTAAFGYAGTGTGKPAWYLPLGAAWFALAFVDAGIGFACRIFPSGPTLPWNPRKPILAVALGILASLLPAYFLARLALPPLPPSGWMALGALILIAACAETSWFGVADNLVIPFSLCVLIPLIPNPLFPYSLSGPALPVPAWHAAHASVWLPILAPAVFGAAAYVGGMLTFGGSILGAIMALLLILAQPWLFAFLGGFFVLGNLATRFGFARKQARGIAEARGGRRGAAEVFGAMGMAAWMTPLIHLTASAETGMGIPSDRNFHHALLVCVAPLVAKTMDTVSSEIGKALGGRTLSLRTLRLVAPGTEGGVSLAGTLAGLAAAGLMAAAILPLRWGGWPEVEALMGMAVLANLFESYWGEYASRRDMDQGPHTNVLMTLVAAAAAWLWWFGLARGGL